MKAVEVLVHASDDVSVAGTVALLGGEPQLRVRSHLEDGDGCPEAVVLVLADEIGAGAFDYLRRLQARFEADVPLRSLLVAGRFRPDTILSAVEHGVVGFVLRDDVSPAVLASAVLAVGRGTAVMPPALQRSFLDELIRLRREVLAPEGLTMSGLGEREREVLRLLAEGYRTDEIAERVPYSEGTVKNVLYGLMSRHGLNSRAHAVAYAVRTGAI